MNRPWRAKTVLSGVAVSLSGPPSSTTTWPSCQTERRLSLIARVFDLHAAGVIGTFDSAVIRKEADGKVRVTKTEKPTQHGLLDRGRRRSAGRDPVPARAGTDAGGLTGHLTGGISRGDLKDLGDALEKGNAAVIVLGESKIEEQLEQATTRANKLIEKQVEGDADDLKREIEAAAQ